mgnify:FL=1
MPIVVASRRLKPETLTKRFGADALVLDLTSRADDPWVRFSPFYPHGGIPVAFSPGFESASVEGIWQGLKVFESTDVDPGKLEVTSMKGLKRTVRRFGRVLGHRRGLAGAELLDYRRARFEIYLPAYRWVLEERLQAEVEELRARARSDLVVLLDYETNCEVENLGKPLSHAGLVKRYLEGQWPGEEEEPDFDPRDEWELGTARIELVLGNIVNAQVEALVNAANSTLLGGGGVDGAIHSAAGPALLAECSALPTNEQGKRCPAGEVRVTGAGNLAASWVIHAVGPYYNRRSRERAEQQLRSVHLSALHEAAERGCSSIGFPAISTGAYRYPVAEAARVSLHAVREQLLSKPSSVKRVQFVLFDTTTLEAFRAALADL